MKMNSKSCSRSVGKNLQFCKHNHRQYYTDELSRSYLNVGLGLSSKLFAHHGKLLLVLISLCFCSMIQTCLCFERSSDSLYHASIFFCRLAFGKDFYRLVPPSTIYCNFFLLLVIWYLIGFLETSRA